MESVEKLTLIQEIMKKFSCRIEIRLEDGSRVEIMILHAPMRASPWSAFGEVTYTEEYVTAEAPPGKICEFLRTHGIQPEELISGE